MDPENETRWVAYPKASDRYLLRILYAEELGLIKQSVDEQVRTFQQQKKAQHDPLKARQARNQKAKR